MVVRVIKIALLVLLPLFIFSLFLYFSWGGKYYREAKRSITNLPEEQRIKSKLIFELRGNYLYSGILMGVSKTWYQGVWVWGAKGPRFFRSDEYTVYSYFQMCTPEILESFSTGEAINPDRTINTDIKKWAGKAKAGDFITIKVAEPANGGNLGRLREAIAHDWWVFNSAIPIDKQCEK